MSAVEVTGTPAQRACVKCGCRDQIIITRLELPLGVPIEKQQPPLEITGYTWSPDWLVLVIRVGTTTTTHHACPRCGPALQNAVRQLLFEGAPA